jgi:hypothetical protein
MTAEAEVRTNVRDRDGLDRISKHSSDPTQSVCEISGFLKVKTIEAEADPREGLASFDG